MAPGRSVFRAMPHSDLTAAARLLLPRAGFSLLLILAVVVRAAEPAAPETVETVMKKFAAAYANATSYQDEGVTLSHDPKKDQPDEILFKTAFQRPAYFRFEWISHHPYPPLRHLKTFSVAWGNDGGVFTYTEPPQLPGAATSPRSQPRTDIGEALAAAAGVSRISSISVMTLLSAEVHGASLLRLQSLELLGSEDFEGLACYHLRGLDSKGLAVNFWVGKADFLLRRATRINGASGNLQEEIRRQVQINREIAPETFTLKGSK